MENDLQCMVVIGINSLFEGTDNSPMASQSSQTGGVGGGERRRRGGGVIALKLMFAKYLDHALVRARALDVVVIFNQ